MKKKSLFKLNIRHFYWARGCVASKTLMLLIIVFYGTVAGLGDKIYKLYKEAHERYIKFHGKSEQNELGVGCEAFKNTWDTSWAFSNEIFWAAGGLDKHGRWGGRQLVVLAARGEQSDETWR